TVDDAARETAARNRLSRARESGALSGAQRSMIAWTIYVTFGGAIITLLLPQVVAKCTALFTSPAGLARRLVAFCQPPMGDRAQVFPDRHLGVDEQGVRRDEVDSLFVLRRHVRVSRDPGGVCERRLTRFESARAVPIFTATASMGVSDFVSRLCRARRRLAVA